MNILHKRADGTFVVSLNGLPYHVTLADPLYAEVAMAAEGLDLPPEPAPVMPEMPVPDISDRQFAHQLRVEGLISQAEALAFVKQGDLPAALAALVAALPTESMRDDAELLICGATSFQRAHPLTAVLSAGFGWDSARTDQFFRAAAAL